MFDRHPSDDVLEEYSLGRLPAAEAEKLEEHLLICAECQDRLAETDEYIRTMRAELQAQAPCWWEELLRGCRAWLARPLPAVGALAAVVLLWFWAAGSWRGGSRPAEAAVVIPLAALRGSHEPAQAPAGKPLALRLDATGLPALESYRLEVVDRVGRPVLETAVQLTGRAIALPRTLTPGRYWVRLHEPGQPAALLREYGLEVGR